MSDYHLMGWREWLGVGERRWKKAPDEEVLPAKTLWDLLQLLVVPVILIAISFAWSAAQTRNDNKRDDRRIAADQAAAEEARQDATLQAYLSEMSRLMLDKKLLDSDPTDAAVRDVADTVTLTTLRRLDGERKGDVVRFLHDAFLLKYPDPNAPSDPIQTLPPIPVAIVRLEGADLTGANLKHANLYGSNLAGANLKHANLEGADLSGVNLSHANLSGAKLGGADMLDVDVSTANLAGADLRAADLTDANLWQAKHLNLEGALNVDLDQFINGTLNHGERERFLGEQWKFLASLSPSELAKFNLTPKKLAELRREVPES